VSTVLHVPLLGLHKIHRGNRFSLPLDTILDVIALIGVGISAFVATNIDDLFILVIFFAAIPRFSIFQIVLGQYVGMGSLIAVSLLGSLISWSYQIIS